MTVEQSTLPRRVAQQRNSDPASEKTNATSLKVIKERTGVEDIHIINEAISACRTEDGAYKLEDVINTLQADDTVRKLRTSKFVKDVVDAVPKYTNENNAPAKTTSTSTSTTDATTTSSSTHATNTAPSG
ncbi:hypothetical protein SNE40_017214 [Patella caerulea]|uniref:Uncharacterized protein n=1 Tax=Patella caerulea TaxID=87958 RepID=A0AAN8JGH4_PATCE